MSRFFKVSGISLPELRGFRSRLPFYSVYFLAFANAMGLLTLMTLLPTYIDLLEPSGIVIGLFVTGVTLAQGVAIVPYGWAGDRYNKQRLLLVGIAICGIAYVLFAFVTTSAGFVGVRFIQGLGVVGVGLLSLAFVSEIAPEEDRAVTIGKYNAWRLFGGLLGAVGAGVVFERYGFETVFGILVVLFVVAILSTWRYTTPDSSSIGFSFGKLALNRRIMTLISFRSQYAFAVTMARNWVPIFAGVSAAQGGLGFTAAVVGLVIAAEQFTNMVCQPFTGKLSDRFGRARFVFFGGVTYGLVAVVVPLTPRIGELIGLTYTYPYLGELPGMFLVLIGLNALLGVADSFREPASMALFADVGNAEGGITSSFGIRNLVWQPGSIVGPLIAGWIMVEVGMEWVFYLAGGLAISGAITFLGILVYTHGRGGLSQW